MAIWDDVIGSISSGTGAGLWGIVFVLIAVGVGFLILGVAAWYWFFKRKWNLKAEIKLTRSDGRITTAEWGKAYYNAKQGACFVRRPGMGQKVIAVKVFDIRKYIQGNNVISFIQLTPEELLPILNTSWEEYQDDKPMVDKQGNEILDDEGNPTYERAALMNIHIDPGLNKAWRAAWIQAAKQAYSLTSFFSQFQTPIAIAIVIIAVFVGFAMMWARLGTVCG